MQALNNGAWIGQSLPVTELQIGTDIAITNNAVLTIQTAGWYRVSGQVAFASAASSRRAITIGIPPASVAGAPRADAISNGGTVDLNVTGLMHFDAGDAVSLLAFQSSGGQINTVANGSESGWLLVEKVT